MQCVGRRLLWCPCVGFCDRGATLVAARETQRLPALRGSNQRVATPEQPTSELPGAHAERSPRPLVLSPFGFRGSRRQWVVSPRTRVSGALAVEDNQPSRQLVLLEPETTAGQPAPRVCKSSLTWIHRGQRALEFGTGLSARDRKRQPAPASTKAVAKTGSPGDNQSHRNPDLPV